MKIFQSERRFQQAASNIICSDLNNNGVQECQQGTSTIPNIDGSASTVSGDKPDSEGEENDSNGNNDGEGNDDGDNEENLLFGDQSQLRHLRG